MAEKLGARVSATLFHVHYRYTVLEDPPIIIRGEPQPKKGDVVAGELNVLSSDPTGEDLRAVVAFEVLGGPKLKPEHQFTILAMNRCCDVRGFAQVVGAGKKD